MATKVAVQIRSKVYIIVFSPSVESAGLLQQVLSRPETVCTLDNCDVRDVWPTARKETTQFVEYCWELVLVLSISVWHCVYTVSEKVLSILSL